MSVDTFGQEVRTWVETGLTATGWSEAYVFPLSGNTQNEFTTVGSGTGCILPMAYPSPPSQISVFNAGSNALAVYPPLGGTINDGTVNAPYSLAAGTGLTYWASSLSNWYSVQTSGSGTVNSGTASNLAFYGATGTAVSGGADPRSGTTGPTIVCCGRHRPIPLRRLPAISGSRLRPAAS